MQFKVDARKLKKFMSGMNGGSGGGGIATGFSGGGKGPLEDVFKQWGARYLAWTKRRFVRNSRGGGEWRKLKEVTRKRRRSGKYGRGPKLYAILRDTGTLLKGLDINAKGNLHKILQGKSGIRVGFGGPARHPNGKATIADIARFHNAGKGRLPKRQIIFKPDSRLAADMLKDLERGINRFGKSL